MLEEFKKFVMRGNVLDMAVGIVIGAAFGSIITSFVKDVVMPPIGLLLGGIDFSNLFILLKQGATSGPYLTLAEAQEAGAVTLNYGLFINTIISFLIIALAIFLVIRKVNSWKKKEEAPPLSTKECPHCFTMIPIKAKRCPNCTSELAK
ncbi:MAG: large-conductance mechanosensitive channel protein MscL [Atribacterota bacterium]|nr:large-conductance mechanosensitive channel protein MscL [Atribacterota bacterium]MDD4896894.1 large-conductance mechanosensitive channel protein MscL [Atribacterota bacterium]MDD5637907.1 large-conductance mechanosensitive channel protein MscL [Atribacterota bacterium]